MSYSPVILPGEPTIYAPHGFKDEEHYHQCVRGSIMEAEAVVRSLEKLLLPIEQSICPQCGRDVKYRNGYGSHICNGKKLMVINGEWHMGANLLQEVGNCPDIVTKEGE